MQTVQDAPMAFCDTRTVDDSDYMPFDRVLSTHVTELMYLRHSESHRWYWLSEQNWDEPAIFTTWDSASGNAGEFYLDRDTHSGLLLSSSVHILINSKTGCVAHVAFENPYAKKQDCLRQSIETTLLVVTRH